jgi:hypothetical protein
MSSSSGIFSLFIHDLVLHLFYLFIFFSREISSSQMDFFRMLDEKIENVCMFIYACN